MTEKYAEKISMLMDDELQHHETANLIEGIKHDEWLRQCWERYHLIGDALKNNLPDMVSHDLAGRVSRALSAEQVYHLSPRTQRKAPSYTKPVVGLALAASLAALAVLVVPWSNKGVNPEPAAQPRASVAASQQANGLAVRDQMVAEPVASAANRLPGQAAVTPAGREVKVEPVLYDYLLDHNEYTDAASVQSTMLPYVRIVGFTSNAEGDHP